MLEFFFQKYRRSNVVETCKRKGIPVIQKDDVTVTGHITVGSSAGSVCEAQWTKPNGIKVCCNCISAVVHFRTNLSIRLSGLILRLISHFIFVQDFQIFSDFFYCFALFTYV